MSPTSCVCPQCGDSRPSQVVRSAATSGAGSTTSGVVSGSLGSREVNYILRVLGPAACRSPNVFTEVATGCIRIALPAPRGSGTGEPRGRRGVGSTESNGSPCDPNWGFMGPCGFRMGSHGCLWLQDGVSGVPVAQKWADTGVHVAPVGACSSKMGGPGVSAAPVGACG